MGTYTFNHYAWSQFSWLNRKFGPTEGLTVTCLNKEVIINNMVCFIDLIIKKYAKPHNFEIPAFKDKFWILKSKFENTSVVNATGFVKQSHAWPFYFKCWISISEVNEKGLCTQASIHTRLRAYCDVYQNLLYIIQKPGATVSYREYII